MQMNKPITNQKLFEPRYGYMGAVEEFPFVTFVVFIVASMIVSAIGLPFGRLAPGIPLLFGLIGDGIALAGFTLLCVGSFMQWRAVRRAGNGRLSHSVRMILGVQLGTVLLVGPAFLFIAALSV